jgi:hypothetical protein
LQQIPVPEFDKNTALNIARRWKTLVVDAKTRVSGR